jgi:small nuclear ribonucleoprotein (snRNP)-like protein
MLESTKWTPWKIACLGLIVAGVGASSSSARAATPLHSQSVSEGNKTLLPLYGKWVAVVLFSGDIRVGKLSDIRVAYVVLRLHSKKKLRIKRSLIVRVSVTRRTRGTVAGGTDAGASEGLTPAQRVKKITARLTAVIGKAVRLKLDDGSHVHGIVRGVDAVHATLLSSAGAVQIPLAKVVEVLPAVRRRPKARHRRPVTGASLHRTRATALVPRIHTTRQGASVQLRRTLLTRYIHLKVSGRNVRNWGIGLLIGGVVLSAIGGGILGAARTSGGVRAGISMSSIGGSMILPGIIMLIAGQVRHIRGVDMENTIYLTR